MGFLEKNLLWKNLLTGKQLGMVFVITYQSLRNYYREQK